ncbi:ATP-dependent dethiobiotin synthetase BioD [Cyanobacterium stanieri LEGE 03274]|uniref:ATP-dependent dethiobiotin synthetase BioD n=1 Tax=Cyanobacterium stanieri LEGE 03274 TaxID=1828756 RepID=A0ABR9V8D4_9CHRO|nr:dethiobiotin synthase [Cyanobacterium stanieri]MBE9223809.1 ATP-dependent dethiobiotin synthetase BioD [Cyanobacterium stanieri LEGE 03274]
MKTLFITGTDTDAGKTIVTTAWRAYYKVYHPHLSTGLMKLLQTGVQGDAEFYQHFFDDVEIPLRYDAPLAPPVAAAMENRSIDMDLIYSRLRALQSDYDLFLVEALGGLGSPITEDLTIAHVADSWALDTILVVPVKLGAIAHTVANVALARQHKINLKGIIFNCVNPCTEEQINNWTPKKMIESFTNIPVLGYFPYVDNLFDLQVLAKTFHDFIEIKSY